MCRFGKEKTMRNLGIQSGGSTQWLMQRVTGITLVVLLAVHTIVTHYTLPAEGINYEWVAQRLSQPLWKLAYLFFLVLCVYHGLSGVRGIIQDYVHRDGLRVIIFGGLVMLGLLMISLGALTIIPFPVRS
jgi:succinate dehydrogenase / fumarate reductase membrane anchor subunit